VRIDAIYRRSCIDNAGIELVDLRGQRLIFFLQCFYLTIQSLRFGFNILLLLL
jgi:hypothetical protein